MTSSVIQSLWIGPSLPEMQRLCISSFLAHGHEFHLYGYQVPDGLPEGASHRNAADFFPEDSVFTYQHGFGKGSFSAFSNLFRYRLLHERGGWWVDTDVVCLRPFDLEDEYVFAAALDDTQSKTDPPPHTSSCVIRSPRGAAYLDYCLKVCATKNMAEIVWSEIGPNLLDEAVKRFDLLKHRLPSQCFTPINVWQFQDFIQPGFEMTRLAGAYAAHLWNQMWKWAEVDPGTASPPDSLYAVLKARYLGTGPAGSDGAR